MVTQQSWMFLRSFVKMREEILKENCIQTMAHLGEHAFDDPAAAGAFVVLFTLANEKPDEKHRLVAMRVIAPKSSSEKWKRLLTQNHYDTFECTQSELFLIPESPLIYWLPANLLKIFKSHYHLKDTAEIYVGLQTHNDNRFVRMYWEVISLGRRWFPYSKGGGFKKWFGLTHWVVDWENDGARVKQYWPSSATNENRYFNMGFTYSDLARGSLSVRKMPQQIQ